MPGGDKAFYSDLQISRPRFNGTFAANVVTATNTSLAISTQVSVGGMAVAGSTLTVPTAGEYEIGIVLRYASQAVAAGVRVARFNINAADRGFFVIPTTTGLNATNISVGGVSRLILAANDQIVFQAFHTAGATISLAGDSHAWVERIEQ